MNDLFHAARGFPRPLLRAFLLFALAACAGAEARYVVYKGSVALDGVSLTVSAVPAPGLFEVNLIPTTLAATSLRDRRPGDRVNLETDVLGRYVDALLAAPAAKPLTLETLVRAGFGEERT